MKRRDLLDRIAAESKQAQVEWVKVRQGAKHEIWSCGGQQVTVPRHREVNQFTAEGIFRDLSIILGEGWWR